MDYNKVYSYFIDYEAQQIYPRETPTAFNENIGELTNHINEMTNNREFKTR